MNRPQTLMRAEVGSYIGRSATSTGCLAPAMSTSHEPDDSHVGVTGTPPPDTIGAPEKEVSRLRARVNELEAETTKLVTEREILRQAAKYFAGETRW